MKNSDRRGFLKQTAAWGAIAVAPALTSCATGTKNTDMSGKFAHHVFFWLKQADDPQVRSDFRDALIKLASIETVRFKHIGTPAATNREIIDTTYTFSLLVVFDDEKEHDIYQEHPIHDEFREKYADWWTRVQIYDTI
ncbi:MAG: Dabb family protein [Bacteroidia bacterium]|nr:Dabb family protein [Bacteroidia bacterium]